MIINPTQFVYNNITYYTISPIFCSDVNLWEYRLSIGSSDSHRSNIVYSFSNSMMIQKEFFGRGLEITRFNHSGLKPEEIRKYTQDIIVSIQSKVYHPTKIIALSGSSNGKMLFDKSTQIRLYYTILCVTFVDGNYSYIVKFDDSNFLGSSKHFKDDKIRLGRGLIHFFESEDDANKAVYGYLNTFIVGRFT